VIVEQNCELGVDQVLVVQRAFAGPPLTPLGMAKNDCCGSHARVLG
jgi:hypothetical protein